MLQISQNVICSAWRHQKAVLDKGLHDVVGLTLATPVGGLNPISLKQKFASRQLGIMSDCGSNHEAECCCWRPVGHFVRHAIGCVVSAHRGCIVNSRDIFINLYQLF